MFKKPILALIPVFLFLVSCNNKPKYTDTATSGQIKIASDESFQPIINAELDVFHELYSESDIKIVYSSEEEAFSSLLKDSVRLIIASRLLTDQEKLIFETVKITPRINKIAEDAVAIIVNDKNKDTLFSLSQLKGILSGKLKQWSQLDKSLPDKPIQVIFDNNNSSNVRYMKQKFGLDTLYSKQTFSANSNVEVINYVKNNTNAMGIIGVNWISDVDDSTTRSFVKSIKVAGIASVDNPTVNDYYQPYQAYIAKGSYPLKREIYVISREARVGLGTGFASFLASERGQRIILKSGLVPATVPLRIISLKNKSL